LFNHQAAINRRGSQSAGPGFPGGDFRGRFVIYQPGYTVKRETGHTGSQHISPAVIDPAAVGRNKICTLMLVPGPDTVTRVLETLKREEPEQEKTGKTKEEAAYYP